MLVGLRCNDHCVFTFMINFSYGKLIILKSETAVRNFNGILHTSFQRENRELLAIFLRYYALTETRIEVVEKHEQ